MCTLKRIFALLALFALAPTVAQGSEFNGVYIGAGAGTSGTSLRNPFGGFQLDVFSGYGQVYNQVYIGVEAGIQTGSRRSFRGDDVRPWSGRAGARVGYVFDDTTLLYGHVGFRMSGMSGRTQSETSEGLRAGVGIEHKLPFDTAPVFIRLDYSHTTGPDRNDAIILGIVWRP